MSSNKTVNKKQCSICGSFKTQIERKVQSPFIEKKYTLYFFDYCCFIWNDCIDKAIQSFDGIFTRKLLLFDHQRIVYYVWYFCDASWYQFLYRIQKKRIYLGVCGHVIAYF